MSNSTWVLDPSHTLIEFSVKHMIFSTVKGRFGKFTGEVTGDLADLTTGAFSVEIAADSVDSRDEQRDGHLRSADFFDVENHPTLAFKSDSITRKGEGSYVVEGGLTVRGITRPVTLDLVYEGSGNDPWGNEKAGFLITGSINRKDFGLLWNAALEAGGVLVGDQVKMEIHAQAMKQAEAHA